MLLGLGLEIVHVDVAVSVQRDDDDAHAGHRCACRIGAVRGGGDQADGAVGLARATRG